MNTINTTNPAADHPEQPLDMVHPASSEQKRAFLELIGATLERLIEQHGPAPLGVDIAALKDTVNATLSSPSRSYSDRISDFMRRPLAPHEQFKLDDIEQYRLQMAGIVTAAFGYWKEGDGLHPDYDTPALHDVATLYAEYASRRDELRAVNEVNERLRYALQRLLARDQSNTCRHGETKRIGAIWTICQQCGAEWVDDEGGMPEWQDPPEWVEARAALDLAAPDGGEVTAAPAHNTDTLQAAPIAQEPAPSPTAGMNLSQRIEHVGGRVNAAGYIEFGSVQAVSALVHQVLRDQHPAPSAQELTDAQIRDVFLSNGFTIKPGSGDLKPYVYAAARALLALRPAAPRAQAPVAWHVIDADGMLMHAATWESAAHEHINDAINEHGLNEAAMWVVRPVYAAPQPAASPRQPLTDEQILGAIRTIGLPRPMGLTRDVGPYEVTEPTYYLKSLVRVIERAHGIGAEGSAA